MQKAKFNDFIPKVVLGVAAHPDDLDFGAGGTFAKWAAKGTSIYYLVLTDGSKGSLDRKIKPEQLVATRQKEQRAAAKALGIKEVFFGDWQDCCLECKEDVKRDITKVIRQVKPDIIVTMDPTVFYVAELGFINHSDHRAAGQATIDAAFPLARDHLSYPELLKEGLEPHATSTLLLINFKEQNWYEDISTHMDTKMVALDEHKSQLVHPKAIKQKLRSLAEDMGKKSGHDYSEGFMRIDIS